MTTIKLNELEVSFPDNWSEVRMDQFLRFMLWIQNKPEKFLFGYEEILYNIELISIFSFDKVDTKQVEKVKLSELTPVIETLGNFVSSIPVFEKRNYVVSDDVLYAFADLNNLSAGEYISFRQISETKKDLEAIPYLLSIICRPAKKVFNEEKKEDMFILDEFNSDDIEWRADKMRSLPALELMGAANFFLIGNEKLIEGLVGSMNKKEVEEI